MLFPHLKWDYHSLPRPDLVHAKGVFPAEQGAEHPSMEQQYGGYCGLYLRPPLQGPCIYILESGISATDSSQLHPSQSQGTALPMVMSPPRAALQQWLTNTEFSKASPEASVATAGWWLLPVVTLPLSPPRYLCWEHLQKIFSTVWFWVCFQRVPSMAIGTRYGGREVDFLESFQWDCRCGSFRAELATNHISSGRRNAAELQLL